MAGREGIEGAETAVARRDRRCRRGRRRRQGREMRLHQWLGSLLLQWRLRRGKERKFRAQISRQTIAMIDEFVHTVRTEPRRGHDDGHLFQTRRADATGCAAATAEVACLIHVAIVFRSRFIEASRANRPSAVELLTSHVDNLAFLHSSSRRPSSSSQPMVETSNNLKVNKKANGVETAALSLSRERPSRSRTTSRSMHADRGVRACARTTKYQALSSNA